MASPFNLIGGPASPSLGGRSARNHILMRAFIAIPLSKEIKENLSMLQSGLKSLDARITWVDPKILHITLEFLGDVEEGKINLVSATIEKACQQVKPFELKLEGLKLIPNIHHPRVIAVSIGDDLDAYRKLGILIRSAIQPLGLFSAKQKAPHVTLGRVKGKFPPRAKKRFLQITKESHFNDYKSIKVREVILTKSTLTQVGPIYTPIAEISLTRSH